MRWHDWLWFTLIYLLCGQIFSLVYCIVLKPEKQFVANKQGQIIEKGSSAWLGLMGLFFPLYLLLDLVMTLASGLGSYSKLVLARFEVKEKGK